MLAKLSNLVYLIFLRLVTLCVYVCDSVGICEISLVLAAAIVTIDVV